MRVAETPKGRLCTFSDTPKGEPNAFELHMRLSQVDSVAFVESTSQAFDRTLHIVRMLGVGGDSLLSCILQSQDDESVQHYNALKTKWYGKLKNLM